MLFEIMPALERSKFGQGYEAEIYRICARIDAIVFVSEQARKRFCILCPELQEKTVHVHTGIEPVCNGQVSSKKIVSEVNRINVVTVGSISTRKNQRSLIKALSNPRFHGKFHLTLLGDGPELKSCKTLVEDMEIEDAFNFVGVTSDVKSYLDESDIFALVSTDEGLPIAALEAMSCGMPLILTDVGGCASLVKGSNGFLISQPTVEEIENTLDDVLENESKLVDMGLNSLKLFNEQYTVTRMIHEYSQLLDRFSNRHSDG